MLAVDKSPFIVGIGGTPVRGSSTEQALKIALAAANRLGAQTVHFDGAWLCRLPHYLCAAAADSAEGRELVSAVRRADGLIIASPAYHGSISGLVKNAIDYIEETSADSRVYLDGVPVGLITTAHGWQATGSTLASLRSVVHALRGWPTPMGAGINSSGGIFANGHCSDPVANSQLELVGQQVFAFVTGRSGSLAALHASITDESDQRRDRPHASGRGAGTACGSEEGT
jgi:FMN reductase